MRDTVLNVSCLSRSLTLVVSTKNKVLKLCLEVMDLKISQAQGEDNQAKIDEEQTKRDNNVKLDAGAAGQASQSVQCNG